VGPEAPKPLKPAKEFVFLRRAPCVTLSEEQLTEPCLWGSAREPLESWWLGAICLELRPWLALKTMREPRIGSRPPSIGSLRLGQALES
jgi:hypothetical protein